MSGQYFEFFHHSIMRHESIFKFVYRFLNHRRKNHAHSVKSVFLSRHKRIELVKAYSANEFVSDFSILNFDFPFHILRTVRNYLYQKTSTIIII